MAATDGRQRSARPGRGRDACRRWRSAITSIRSQLDRRTDVCDDNELVRPEPRAGGYAPPTALTPGYCALSMLFSDWDRSGRRDLRVSNDRHTTTCDGAGAALAHRRPAQPPRLYTEADGWAEVQI